jgi:redox-sensitive bicupin YhaK (pirin superfamily)
MSGPVTPADAPEAPVEPERAAGVEVWDARESQVGALRVRRALPRRARRTVGAWCFADVMDPTTVTEAGGVDIGPHPHCGLQTVTWLVAGELLHRDSLGSEQVIRAGQLNLMTAGHGVSHAEEATGRYRGTLQGVQLWVAQPESTRHGAAAFEHHDALPSVDVGGGAASAVGTVLVGEFAGAESPARRDTELVGVDLSVASDAVEIPLVPTFEHAVVVLDGAVTIDGGPVVAPGQAAYVGPGRSSVALAGPARMLLLGGEPFESPILMWWNFVARTRAEIDDAYASWQADDGRFGRVGSRLPRIPAPRPSWAVSG